jgi:hypothetical protein
VVSGEAFFGTAVVLLVVVSAVVVVVVVATTSTGGAALLVPAAAAGVVGSTNKPDRSSSSSSSKRNRNRWTRSARKPSLDKPRFSNSALSLETSSESVRYVAVYFFDFFVLFSFVVGLRIADVCERERERLTRKEDPSPTYISTFSSRRP